MDAVINPICERVIDCAVLQVVKQVGYLLNYRDNFKKLEDTVNQLQGEREMIEHKIEEEEKSYGNQKEGCVQAWLDRVNEFIEEARQLVEDQSRAGVGCEQWSCPNLRLRRKLSKTAKQMVENATNLLEEGKFERVTSRSPTDYLEISSGALTFGSREPIMKEMMETLKDPKKRMIGVYGLGGVGKTTLAEEVSKEAKKNNIFNAVVKARVGENPQLEKIQDDIAELLDMKLDEKSVIKRAYLIRKRIEKEKSVLVILDDVWTAIKLEDAGIPEPSTMNFEDGGVSSTTAYNLEKGKTSSKANNMVCKILITSRSEDVLLKMGSEINFRIELLSEEEAWSLFKVKAGPNVVEDYSLRPIATQIAQKCGGLPVIITTMATTLKNKSIHDWEVALRKLARACDTKVMNDIIYSALELSYNWLESNEVKELFLLCSVDGGYSVVSDLLKYGIGLGIFKNMDTVEDARNDLYQMICSLRASCLLLDDTSMEFVTMHDTIREVAISIASRSQYFLTKREGTDLKEWPMDDLLQRCPLIVLHGHCIGKLPERLECPKLEYLYLNGAKNPSFNIPDSFFEGMGNLKVLDLTSMIMSSLPTSLSSLTKLKTLCLDQCVLGDMIGIGDLTNLEILSLFQSSMIQLPCEIGKLTNLKMLDLTNSGIEVTPPNVMSKLIKLEELYLSNSTIKWEVEDLAKKNRNASLAELRPLINLTALEIQIQDARMLPKDLKFEKLVRYKIIVGDIWDRFEKYEALKTLKLKLGFSIDLEDWVKVLIKTVENLYLDEINDISNVLHLLNDRGFSPLKYLHIQNNTRVQHVVSSIERKNQAYVSFPNLETLSLKNLSNLETICYGPETVNSFSKLRVIKVKSCDQLKYLLLVSMVKTLSQLIEMEVSECHSVKKIVLMEYEDNVITIDKIEFASLRSLTLQYLPVMDDFCSYELMSSTTKPKFKLQRTSIPTSFFDAKLALPHLETLKLSSINITKIWDDDQLSAVASSIHNLVNLIVEDCGGLKYIFSSSKVESLSNLKQLEISKCDLMEEIIATQRDNGITSANVRFSKLERVTVKDMKNLKAVWHYQFEGLKKLEAKNCEKIRHIFPSDMQKTFESVETLIVSECISVEEIFELSGNEEHMDQHTTHLKELTLLRLPKLQRIWSKDPQNSHRFQNLQTVYVEDCEDLEYLFPFSIAMDLPQLEQIVVEGASQMKEIVSKKDGVSLDRTVKFEFNHLTSLVLCNLLDLKRFYAGNHSLACPSLRELFVFDCAKLKLFKKQSSSSQGRISDSKLHVSMQQPLFNVEEVVCNLETLAVNSEDASTILQCQLSKDHFCKLKDLRVVEFEVDEATFPYWLLQNTSSLESLRVEWSSFKEIFQFEMLRGEKGKIAISIQLKHLMLHELHNLEHICKEGSQIDPVLDLLETLIVEQCSSLVILVPSPITFNNLVHLEVENCSRLVNLITSSTARSMIKLRKIKIRECNLLEQIVNEGGDRANEDIVFSSLLILELECLPRLNMFCSAKCLLKFPLLEKVVVRQCPRMELFSAMTTSTPMLHKVLVEENDEEWCWNGDLNLTIKKMFVDKVGFCSFKYLELSDYPELKGLWNHQVSDKIFSNLRSLVVQKCEFLPDVLLSPKLLQELSNLEELDVRDCDSLEVVLDLSSMDEQGMPMMKEGIQLKKITLFNLPKLKHIWKLDSQEIINVGNRGEEDEVDLQRQQPLLSNEKVSFHSFQRLKLSERQELWYNQAGNKIFCNLKTLVVHKCNFLSKVLFPWNLLQLLHTLEELEVRDCDLLEAVFDVKVMDDKMHVKKINQLKILTLSDLPNLKHIWNKDSQRLTSSFGELKVVKVTACQNLVHLFSVSLCQDLGQLEELNIESCGIEEIAAIEEGSQELRFDFPKLTILRLISLAKLKSFYPRRHTLKCLSLKTLNVHLCEALQVFCFDNLKSQQLMPSMVAVDMPTQQAFFYVEKVSPNLEELALSEKDAMRILNGHYEGTHFHSLQFLRLQYFQESPLKFLYDFLENIPNTTTLQLRYSSFETLFPSKGIVLHGSKSHNTIRSLGLYQLEQLKHIWNDDSTSDPLVRNLEGLSVIKCSSLTRLAPPSISFKNLTTLELEDCKGLIYLMTISTAKSLGQLQSLTIKNCEMIENVVVFDGGESEEEITFENLEDLQLISLSCFKSFCSGKGTFIFPSLENLIVGKCPKMQNFSSGLIIAPLLRAVKVEDGKKHWKEDLNTTIKQQFMNKAIGETDEGNSMESSISISLSPTTVQGEGFLGPAIEAQETCETIKKLLVQAVSNTEDPTIIRDEEKSHDGETSPDQNLFKQTTTSETATKSTQTIDPSPPQAPTEALTPSVLASDAYTSYMGMFDISLQNLPYLEAGVKRHPQVLDWLNTRQHRRAFASSFFSLFADVTRLLRTTRRGYLSEDDRNYIIECCSSLQGVGFDASWLNYVKGCIEKCDDGKMLKRTLEETEGKASILKTQLESIKKELASVEASLIMLRDKASRLHDFIES